MGPSAGMVATGVTSVLIYSVVRFCHHWPHFAQDQLEADRGGVTCPQLGEEGRGAAQGPQQVLSECLRLASLHRKLPLEKLVIHPCPHGLVHHPSHKWDPKEAAHSSLSLCRCSGPQPAWQRWSLRGGALSRGPAQGHIPGDAGSSGTGPSPRVLLPSPLPHMDCVCHLTH